MRAAHSTNIAPGMGPERTRTISSDSGCDVHLDPIDHHTSSLEIIVKVWQARLAEVVNQEVNRADEVTQWATEALRHCNQDDGRREKILERWKRQMEGVLDFTNDLVECVNNDTKEFMIGTADGFHELDTSIEEEEDNEEEGRNTEKLFVLPSPGMKHRGIKKGFQKVQNVFKRQENPPNMTTLDRNCPSMKSISDDLDDFDNWKLKPKDIEFEGKLKEVGHHLEHSKDSTSASTQLSVNRSHYWDEKYSADSLMILLLNEIEEGSKDKLANLESPFLPPKSSLDLDVIFVSPGQEKDALTNWNVWDKFGETWDDEYEYSVDDNAKISEKQKDINIKEVFWSISLSLNVSRKEPSLLSVIRNLPVWDSPDIFLDSSDKVTINKQAMDTAKDPINIFKSIRHIFDEPTKYIRQTKYTNYQKSIAGNLTNWNNSHKFGQHWESAEVQEKKDIKKNKNVCIVKVFWKISLDEKLSRREPRHSNVIFNLPVHDWPDVMTDDWEMPGAGGGKNYKNTEKDPVTIFKSFKHIFVDPETEYWNWMHCEKSGKPWEMNQHEPTLEYVSKEKKDNKSNVDVMEIFWRISQDESCCMKDKKQSELNKHFPAWFGPDVFEDSWDFPNFSDLYYNEDLNQNKNKPKDPINIFRSFRKVFSELASYQKKEKVEIMLSSNISKEEDFFQDWFVNVLNASKLKRNMHPDTTYLTEIRPNLEKKLRRDPDFDMARQEHELLKLLENWRI